ncbi:MAG: hypothetical protein R6U10_01415 [Thermoplasmatota archaeon]
MKATPLYNRRALHLPRDDAAVVADLHIGIEYELSLTGANIPSQTAMLASRCSGLCRDLDASSLLIAGDLKHMIAASGDSTEHARMMRQERWDLRSFTQSLSERNLELVKGNHDGGLYASPTLAVYGSGGICRGDVAIAHGHAWPADEVMQCELLVMGHVHPTVRLRDELGFAVSKPCWLRAPLLEDAVLKRYPDANPEMEVVVMPAFNPLSGGMAVNTEGILGPMQNIVDVDAARVYLLDGTHLGSVASLRL